MKRKVFALFLALAMVFAFSHLAMADWPNNPPTPTYTDGSADGKVDAVQGVNGVAGLVTTTTSAKGLEVTAQSTTTYSGDGAIGINGFVDVNNPSGCNFGSDCDKAGIVGVGHFTYTQDKTNTFSNLCVDNKQVANVFQNTANMNGSLIASVSACGLPVALSTGQNQTFAQAVTNGQIPNPNPFGGSLGTVSSNYTGAQASNIQIGNPVK
jgi:hypothetical protein